MSKISFTILTDTQTPLDNLAVRVFFRPFEIATVSYRLHCIELAGKLNEQDPCCWGMDTYLVYITRN